MNLQSKFKLIYETFVKPEKKIAFSKQCEYLIYDNESTETILYCLPELKKFQILYTRGERIYVSILLRSLLKKKFYRNPLLTYQETFVRTMNPRVIITHIDNNPLFYELVSEFPKVLSFLIQNGIRDDFLRNNNNYRENSVTYTLVHNRNIGQYYSSKLTTKIILVGSIRNNSVPIDINRSKTKLVYISTFVDQGSSEDGQINLPSGNVTYSDFLAIEKRVFTRVLNWSSVNSLDLVVAGAMRNKASAQRERNFFLTLAGSKQIEYSPRTDLESTYKLIDTSAMVVSIDSTIGYEALARGHKVALLSVRANILGHDDRLIGFPNLIDNKLPFATQDSNLDDCDSVLDYVWSCNLETWKKIVQDASPELMVYDPGNLILKKLLE